MTIVLYWKQCYSRVENYDLRAPLRLTTVLPAQMFGLDIKKRAQIAPFIRRRIFTRDKVDNRNGEYLISPFSEC